MKKTYENTIPLVSAINDTSKSMTVYGETQPSKRCSICRMELLSGVEFYQATPSHPSGYAVDRLCYKLKNKYRMQWKKNKSRIVKKLRKNHIDHFETRATVFESIYRTGGDDNHFE